MKKIYTLLFAVLALAATSSAQLPAWNISDASFLEAVGITGEVTSASIIEVKVVDGLTIYGADGKNVDIETNGKTVTYKDVEYTYTHRLKFGGTGAFDSETGAPLSRVLAFDVEGPCDITVMCMSSSSGSDRVLNVAAGSQESLLGEATALGPSLTASTITYTGEEATTIYMWSPSSGVNLYHIIVEEPSPTAINAPKAEGQVVATEYFNISGVRMGNNFDVLPAGIYLQVKQYANGAVVTDKIVKNIR